jgi:periplasmic divalent cation tolerance protein
MTFVYITCQNKEEANKISIHLLKKKLAACTNIFPIDSRYSWKGKIIEDKEYAMFAKTIAKNYEKIKKEVKKIHTYTVPCICLIYSKSNKEYENWLKKVVK